MTYRVHVRVVPRAGLLDPQGQAVEHALTALGFREAGNVRIGKAIELDVEAPNPDEARVRATRIKQPRRHANTSPWRHDSHRDSEHFFPSRSRARLSERG